MAIEKRAGSIRVTAGSIPVTEAWRRFKRRAKVGGVWLCIGETRPIACWECVGEEDKRSKNLALRIMNIILRESFPQEELRSALQRWGRVALLVEERRRRFEDSDVSSVLSKFIEGGEGLPRQPVRSGTAWLVPGPAGEPVDRWFEGLLDILRDASDSPGLTRTAETGEPAPKMALTHEDHQGSHDRAEAEPDLRGASLKRPEMTAQGTIERFRDTRDREAAQGFLCRFVVGKTWGNLKDNQDVAHGVTEHLRYLKLRVACTDDDEPSNLRCWGTTGNPTGSFYFEHHGGKPNHGGFPVVPPLELLAAPPDRRRKSAR